ncbi:uncharacterized protein BDR25DRAFT_300232 [Lindgomyces ingoldianus]|uniref:Uncharacterized protein n=1 Tax=Lindgomyces ingoldianus TaxID=673940 RepID=A0ACB6RD89_9PLEO|nr:uncharacterized protein BDR25DRAFT_300232 [Lindgomyces ingoldianus]KAF2477219.1 hypothetical protein BDR25DRAFT_300232 [Lindgomyces ingoldianus]
MATIEELDKDIAGLRNRISRLRSHRSNLTSILLSSPLLTTRLQQRPVTNERCRRSAAKAVKQQSNRNVENIYRACAGVTAYKVKDPDPNAVDDGNILGVRIEVPVDGQFIETYHVLFNRPDPIHPTMLKIHKHTIPPCIPLQALANKFLPVTDRDADTTTEQNLIRFGRWLRKELVSWHLRIATVQKLRCEAGLSGKASEDEVGPERPSIGQILNAFGGDSEEESDEEGHTASKDGPVQIEHIEADHAVREIRITWSNGQTGVMKVAKDGEVEKSVIRSRNGSRVLQIELKAVGRIEGLVQRLTEAGAVS